MVVNNFKRCQNLHFYTNIFKSTQAKAKSPKQTTCKWNTAWNRRDLAKRAYRRQKRPVENQKAEQPAALPSRASCLPCLSSGAPTKTILRFSSFWGQLFQTRNNFSLGRLQSSASDGERQVQTTSAVALFAWDKLVVRRAGGRWVASDGCGSAAAVRRLWKRRGNRPAAASVVLSLTHSVAQDGTRDAAKTNINKSKFAYESGAAELDLSQSNKIWLDEKRKEAWKSVLFAHSDCHIKC